MEANLRKRQREDEAAAAAAAAMNQAGPFSFQAQSHLMNMNLSLLQHQNINTGLRLSSDDSMALDCFAKRQREELDWFLKEKGEEMRRGLAEKRQRYVNVLMSMAEESLSRKLRAKDVEMEKATQKNAELEKRAEQLSVEAQVWRAKAKAHEMAATTLRVQLQQAMMAIGEGQAEDAESVCEDRNRTMDDQFCKSCRRRAARVLLLPCRHLALCQACNMDALACPVCLHARNSSVEVLFC